MPEHGWPRTQTGLVSTLTPALVYRAAEFRAGYADGEAFVVELCRSGVSVDDLGNRVAVQAAYFGKLT